MPTDSPPDILDRNLSKAWVRHLIDLATPMLQEIVNHGVAAFARCSKTSAKTGDENAAILMPYLHLLEMVDGTQVLLAEAAPVAARLLLRSAFEALLTIEYITEADTKKRAYAYLVAEIRERLAVYRTLDPNTPQGKRARKRLEDDKCVQDMQMPEIQDLSGQIENLEKLLRKPHWKDADAEFQAVKKRLKGRRPAWYQLYGGPSNLDALATHLRRAGEYDILYRRWSRTAHAVDAIQRISKGKKGEVLLRRLRDTSEFDLVTSFAALFAIMATDCVISFLRPGERWQPWYVREVQETLRKFSRRESDRGSD